MYYLKDYNDEDIQGGFYEEELQKTEAISNDRHYAIEKIIKTKKEGKKKYYFVKWLGYSDNFNSWISEDEIKPLNN